MASILKIRGGQPLQGHVKAAGAKNSITKLLVASLVSDRVCRFTNVPDIGDVEVTVELCREIGSEVEWEGIGNPGLLWSSGPRA